MGCFLCLRRVLLLNLVGGIVVCCGVVGPRCILCRVCLWWLGLRLGLLCGMVNLCLGHRILCLGRLSRVSDCSGTDVLHVMVVMRVLLMLSKSFAVWLSQLVQESCVQWEVRPCA